LRLAKLEYPEQPRSAVMDVRDKMVAGRLGVIIIAQRFYRQLITSLRVIANFFDVSNLMEDDVMSGATDNVEK